MYTFDLIVGDWSSDGHGRTEQFTVKSSLSKERILEALQQAYKSLDIENSNPYFSTRYELPLCEDYEDNVIPKEVAEKLEKVGLLQVVSAHSEVDSNKNGEYALYPESFTVLWINLILFGAKKLWPDEEHKIHFVNNDSRITIGGYGLFWD